MTHNNNNNKINNTSIRIENEKSFHNKRFSDGKDNRYKQDKFYVATEFAKIDFRRHILKLSTDKNVLEYGCGAESNILEQNVDFNSMKAIDISDSAIELSKTTFLKYSKMPNVGFSIMNAEELDFTDKSFDVIVGSGILHHLDLNKAFNEIQRVLKKDGVGIFFEPLGHNPLINIYRRMTPNARTDDEHPLLMEDIKFANKFFSKVEVDYYVLTALFFMPFSRNILNSSLFNKLDEFLFKIIPALKKHAWVCVIRLKK